MKRWVLFFLAIALLLTNSACAAAESTRPESTPSSSVIIAEESASGMETQNPEPAPLSTDSSFADVSQGDWFFSAVEYCRENGLMAGKSATRFAPYDNMTRAELARYFSVVIMVPAW